MIDYVKNIQASQLTIYDHIDPENSNRYIPTSTLEEILSNALVGFSVAGYKNRARSKIIKTEVCKILGYPVPKKFEKTKPRFPGQNFDVFGQKGSNVQIWNETIDKDRRFAIIGIDKADRITAVRVITGSKLATFDKTGKLTKKYQATMTQYNKNICSVKDTEPIRNLITADNCNLSAISPIKFPLPEQLLGITEIYKRLLPLVGNSISYVSAVDERNRGAELHSAICHSIGYSSFKDDGKFPDIKNQLLEIKLQTSPTIDLGSHSPEEDEKIVTINGTDIHTKDIRYAVFDGDVRGSQVYLKNLYLVTGKDFPEYFPLFKGKKTNSKIQLPLPKDFFYS